MNLEAYFFPNVPLWLFFTSMALLIFHLNISFRAKCFFERICTQLSPYLYSGRLLLPLKNNILHLYLCFETTSPLDFVLLPCSAIKFFSFMWFAYVGSIFCPLKRARAEKIGFKVLLNRSSYFESEILIATPLVIT